MKKIVIAGGTGFLGQLLTEYFENLGFKIIILSRSHRVDKSNVTYVKWDGKSRGYWTKYLEGATALINLNGKSVDCRYHEVNKQLIYDTRIESTYILGEALKSLDLPPAVWINASSATIYRHAVDRVMDEETGELGTGFSVDVCKKWEQVFFNSESTSIRKVALRIAIVLGRSGGALQPLKQLARLGFGGRQGSGKQYFSWIHQSDFCRIVEFIINNQEMRGFYNVAAPDPIPNYQIMKHIRNLMRMPIGLSMPEWMLKIGAFLIRTETELILKSRRVVPGRLILEGYKFVYPCIKETMKDLLGTK